MLKKKVTTPTIMLVKELMYQEILKKVMFAYLMISSLQFQYTQMIHFDIGFKCEGLYYYVLLKKLATMTSISNCEMVQPEE